MDNNEFEKLKQSFKDLSTTLNIEGKTATQLNTGVYKKELLAEAIVKLSEICQKAFNLYEVKSQSVQVVDQVAQKVQDVITIMVPKSVSC